MTVPLEYRGYYVKVKYFLNSYRALADGRSGIRFMHELLAKDEFFLSDWKIAWTGTISTLRTSIDLFQIDARSCIDAQIREEIFSEWKWIKEKPEESEIFWKFLRKERNSIMHEYAWSAYESWLKADGTMLLARISLLSVRPEDAKTILPMRHGNYKGRDSIELMEEAAQWAEDRIFSAIRRAGYDPEEKRELHTFRKFDPKNVPQRSLVPLIASEGDGQ